MNRGMHCVAALCVGLALAPAVLACGDRLAALGGGVRFERVFYSRHPGRVVLYAPTATRLRAADERLGIAEALKRAGHQVTSVGDRDALLRAIGAAAPDVVVIDAEAERGALPDARETVPVVPVAFRPGRDAVAARTDEGCVVEIADQSVRQLLRTVETVLERRRRGQSDPCRASARPATP
jgi:CheY-like chemotaxis protein